MKNPLHEIFIPEAEENLLILEDRIIGIENNPGDREIINEAFRAIHSIKGGAGLAGFDLIKDFSHVAEDLFEEIRNGSIKADKSIISVMLKSMDILKGMIDNISHDISEDEGLDSEGVKLELLKILNRNKEAQDPESQSAELINKDENHQPQEQYFYMELDYYPDLMKSGTDPLMFIKDLKQAGTLLLVNGDISQFPGENDFDPTQLYLKWQCFYKTTKPKTDIDAIFCFVIDESNINIHALDPDINTPQEISSFTIRGKTILDFMSGKKETTEELIKKTYRRSTDLAASSYIRVQTEKLEKIFNTVSELIISEAHLNLLTEQYEDQIPDEFTGVSDTLKEITRLLQEQVTSLRMMSLRNTFDRFKRVVRDLAMDLGKTITLKLDGQDTELDKNMIEKLNDPLKHIVRNSIDHGIETEAERIAKGKPAEGLLEISAYFEDGKVIIEIRDDGKGIDKKLLVEKAIDRGIIANGDNLTEAEILSLIFHPGLSTAKAVTDLSGRGVGMDVVRNSIRDLNGNIEVQSVADEGTCIKLYLPLTLAILDGMLVDIGKEKYIIPTLSILEIFRPGKETLKTISGKGEVVFFRGDYIPLLRIHEIFGVQGAADDPSRAELIVVQSVGIKAALLVDNVLEQFQVVLKSLQNNYKKVVNVSSATILGNGDVALIIDIQNIIQNFAMRNNV